MKLHFANKQEFQLEALKTITDIFEGQTLSNSIFHNFFGILVFELILTINSNTKCIDIINTK